jgi:hypothetical protein
MIIEFPQATRRRLGDRTLNEAEMGAIGIMRADRIEILISTIFDISSKTRPAEMPAFFVREYVQKI